MSDFNIDDYEKVVTTDLGCNGCDAFESDSPSLCDKLVDDGCFDDYVFKLKDKSKGESDD